MTAEFNSCLKQEFTKFMEFCEASYAEHTCRMYRGRIISFDQYLCDIDFKGGFISSDIIDGWLLTLHGLKNYTIAGYLTAIRGCMNYLRGHGIYGYIPENRKKRDEYSPYIFTDEEVERIFDIADNYDVRPHNKLPYIQLEFPMVLRILYGCGTRLVETLSIQMKDVDLDRSILIMRNTKWNKERYVPMSPSLGTILEQYVRAMKLLGKPDAYLFPRKTIHEPLQHFDLRNRFNLTLRLADISLEGREFQERGPCMHCFRHGFVFHSFKQLEADNVRIDDAVPILSIYLGHYDLKETEKYMKFSSQLFPEELDKFESYSDDIFSCMDWGSFE